MESNTTKIKAVAYCRVSSKEQEETGYSLDSQEKLLKDYALKNGFNIVKVFRISESASGRQIRKSFDEMFEYTAKNKVPILLAEKIDRLTRNLKSAAIADEWVREDPKRAIHFVKESFILNSNSKAHDNLVWDMKVAIARFYTNNLSEETRKGQREKIAQGWLPKAPPIGYKTVGEKGHKIQVIDSEEAPLVRKLFELYDTGNYSIKALDEIIYKEGLRGKSGKRLQRSKIHYILTNPFYIGKSRWNGELHQGAHETLVSKELFDSVQAKLARKTDSPQYKKHLPVFKAKVKCEECGGIMTWENQKNHWYGRHSNYFKYDDCDKRIYIRQEKIEEQLMPFIEFAAPKSPKALEWLEKALKESHQEEIGYYDSQRNALNMQFEKIQKRLETIYEDKIDGKIPAEFYERKFNEYSGEKELILEKLGKLNKSSNQYYEAGYAIHELALNAVRIYSSEKAETVDKRLLLSLAFSNIMQNAEKITPEYTLPFQFLIEWMPKVNKIFEPKKGNKDKELFFSKSETALLGAYRDLNPNREFHKL